MTAVHLAILQGSFHENIVNSQALTSRTAEALQQLHSALYCTTTYKDTHRNFFTKKEKNSQHKKYFSVVKTAADYTDLADDESYGEIEETVEVQGLEDENSRAETNMVETSTEEDYQSDETIAENGILVYSFSPIFCPSISCLFHLDSG